MSSPALAWWPSGHLRLGWRLRRRCPPCSVCKRRAWRPRASAAAGSRRQRPRRSRPRRQLCRAKRCQAGPRARAAAVAAALAQVSAAPTFQPHCPPLYHCRRHCWKHHVRRTAAPHPANPPQWGCRRWAPAGPPGPLPLALSPLAPPARPPPPQLQALLAEWQQPSLLLQRHRRHYRQACCRPSPLRLLLLLLPLVGSPLRRRRLLRPAPPPLPRRLPLLHGLLLCRAPPRRLPLPHYRPAPSAGLSPPCACRRCLAAPGGCAAPSCAADASRSAGRAP
jgi:hypothetical protein